MKRRSSALQLLPATFALFFSAQLTIAQTNPALVPVSMVVTLQARHGSGMDISSGNVTVYQGHARAKVTDCVALQGDRAALELFLLIDDLRNVNRGTQLEDIRRFILAQPASTKIGVAYMQTGGPNIVQGLTADHALAASALHVPLSNLASSASPYSSLSDLIENWTMNDGRREILMISNGIDQIAGNSAADQYNVYVDAAVEKAERAGVIVSTIATTGDTSDVNRADVQLSPERGFSQLNTGHGKDYLAQIAEGTGGEPYYYKSAVSFAPYLEDYNRRLNSQYLVTFLAQSSKDPSLQSVKFGTDIPHTKLVSAGKVYVPAAQ